MPHRTPPAPLAHRHPRLQVTASPPTFVEDLDVVDLAPSAAFTAEKADTVVNLQDMEASLRGHPDPAREGGNDEGLAEAHPLRHVFDRAAVSGSVAVEQIPDLIRATHPGATDRVIRDAIEEIAPAAPGGFLVNFEQLEEVWHVVLEEMAHEGSSAGSPVATTRGAGWCRPWATCRRAFARRRAGRAPPRETDAKPTKRLLLVATSATSVIALGVASFAVAFFLADTVASSERGLVHTAGLRPFGTPMGNACLRMRPGRTALHDPPPPGPKTPASPQGCIGKGGGAPPPPPPGPPAYAQPLSP